MSQSANIAVEGRHIALEGLVATAVGGTVSEITGGKFGNGAFSALFAFVANRMNEDSKEKVRKKKYSIKADDGRELNPDGYVIENETVRNEVKKLYEALKIELGTDDFVFQVTGGDSYWSESEGVARSATNNSIVENRGENSPHNSINGNRGVDLRIKYNSGLHVPLSITQPLIDTVKLELNPRFPPTYYNDRHYHLKLPNYKIYGGKY